jgi:hypothetical protein
VKERTLKNSGISISVLQSFISVTAAKREHVTGVSGDVRSIPVKHTYINSFLKTSNAVLPIPETFLKMEFRPFKRIK